MSKQYKLIHVRGGARIGVYWYNVPESNLNPTGWINVSPLNGLTTYEAFVARCMAENSHITNMSKGLLCVRENSSDVTSSLINGLTGAGVNYFNIDDFQVNDRLYISRWDAKHSYLLVSSKSSYQIVFQYYTYEGVLTYTAGCNVFQTAIQHGYATIPWLWDTNNIGNGYLSEFTLCIDTRDNGLYQGSGGSGIAPTSLGNAIKFWYPIKPFDDIDTPTSTPIGGPNTGDGFGGDYDFEGDDIDMPSAPDETVSGVLASGFLNIYSPSASQLQQFGSALWTNAFNVKWYDLDSVNQLIMNAVSDPINFIVGLFMLPITPSKASSTGIYLGGLNLNNVTAPRVTEQYVTIDFGTIEISELYGNYLDYANSKLSIYLPYVGTADLDIQEVNGGTVSLQYTVDCFTGACVANVQCIKLTNVPWGDTYQNKTVHSYSGNMAIQLPISAGSFDTMTQGLINVGLGMMTSNPAIAITGGKDVITGLAGNATTRGSLSSNTGKLGYQTPYLMFTRPIECRPANLGSLHGYSAGVGGKLSSFSGYIECSDVKLDGVTATDSELNEIETMLKSGVYV